ncbi:phospholipase A1-like [Nasonia vitripennis]|uniref:phospholipase A1 n=1 Tax=Nasonia vitripennis TaxID=7425 RepID=A0A7M7G9F6_NASVI|nr:phospholipase A1-like [Nasonia vitripennis]
MNPTTSIVPLFVFCGTVLGDLPSVMESPSMDDTPSVNLTSDGVVIQDVLFFLYTKKNPKVPQQLYYKNLTILNRSFLNFSQPLKVVVHGWRNNHTSDIGTLLRKAFLDHGSFNVLSVDWGKIAYENYLYAANRVSAVGALVGEMIDFLVDMGSDPRNISVVGHSLGAHVAGLAALQADANISHVVGLDPAGPGFRLVGTDGRISTKDANYVEIIHTCAGNLGVRRPLGHADFYPNGGGPRQPGCGADLIGSCAHSRSYKYYAESLKDPDAWYAIMCNSSKSFDAGECEGNNIQPFPRWKADYHKPPGIYQLRTASSSPYGLGINGTVPTMNETLISEIQSIPGNVAEAIAETANSAVTTAVNVANKTANAAISIVKG